MLMIFIIIKFIPKLSYLYATACYFVDGLNCVIVIVKYTFMIERSITLKSETLANDSDLIEFIKIRSDPKNQTGLSRIIDGSDRMGLCLPQRTRILLG